MLSDAAAAASASINKGDAGCVGSPLGRAQPGGSSHQLPHQRVVLPPARPDGVDFFKELRAFAQQAQLANPEVEAIRREMEQLRQDYENRLLQLAAELVARALEHSRLLHEHHLAATLQESLLPERLPEVGGLTFAARYLPGQGGSVGGDWYDVVPLPGVGMAVFTSAKTSS